jgi:type IV pilus assembly protein PilM
VLDFFRINSTPLVGVDISSSSVKVLELSRVNDKYLIENYGIELLPSQSVSEKNIKAVDKVTESLRRLMSRTAINRKFAAIGVAGSSVILRTIQLNADYTEEKISEQIEIEADRYIPYPLEEVYYDFEVIGPSTKHPELMDVLLAASRTEAVDTRVAAVTDAGLKVTVVDVEALAVERAFELVAANLPSKGMGQNIALVDIGSTSTSLYVFRDLKTIHSRDQAFGGKHLTDEIQRRYSLSLDEAIAAQKYGGLPEDYTTEVLEPFKETVVQQLSRGLQIFFSSSEETEVHYIVLAGGVAELPGLDSLIQNKLSLKTSIANPFLEMEVSPRVNRNILNEEAPSLMMTCGLALRTFNNE